jgi:dihydrofolate synthase/folylpolyglutamate synthase
MSDVYQNTLDYLYSYVDYSLTKISRYSAANFDLARMYEFVARLDYPNRGYPIIHIAGTKGKGSVAALCQSALTSAGYRVGMYTSPHMHDYAERMQVDGVSISHQDLINLVEEIKPVVESIPELTTFEITTALAFLYFERQEVNTAVVEVGLGGRLDATNVVQPSVSVITSLSYDHTYLLGNTLAEIAREKAGIIKPGIPVVLSPQVDEARQVIEEIAAERGSPLTQVGVDYLYTQVERSFNGQTIQIWRKGAQYLEGGVTNPGGSTGEQPARLSIPLAGYHQVQNAATAYATLQIFKNSALPVSEQAILKGFSSVVWPGRFEIMQLDPPVVIDAAHNRDSARILRMALDDYFPGQDAIMVFGASEDKDIEGMFAELTPRIGQVIATKSYHPRAIEAERIAEIAQQFNRPAKIVQDVADALDEAMKISGVENLVVVTGSIFIAAGAREAWFARKGVKIVA